MDSKDLWCNETEMRVHHFQHVPVEGLAYIRRWCRDRNYDLQGTRWFDGGLAPDWEGIDLLIVMGGSMSVWEEDRHPWLRDEKQALMRAMEAKVPVLGICMGAQLIADVLGARVYPNEHLVTGWRKVRFLPAVAEARVFRDTPLEVPFFHWHGDTFDLPPGMLHIAAGEAGNVEAFGDPDGRIVGLQFHPEVELDTIRHLIDAGRGAMEQGGPWVQNEAAMLEQAREAIGPAHEFLTGLLDKMVGTNFA